MNDLDKLLSDEGDLNLGDVENLENPASEGQPAAEDIEMGSDLDDIQDDDDSLDLEINRRRPYRFYEN
jgi:hypothetical protein